MFVHVIDNDRELDQSEFVCLFLILCWRFIVLGAVSVGAGYGIMALLLILAIALTYDYD